MKTAGIIIGVLMVGGAVVALSNNASASNTNAVNGCTFPNATNYNPNATVDNGTCLFEKQEDSENYQKQKEQQREQKQKQEENAGISCSGYSEQQSGFREKLSIQTSNVSESYALFHKLVGLRAKVGVSKTKYVVGEPVTIYTAKSVRKTFNTWSGIKKVWTKWTNQTSESGESMSMTMKIQSNDEIFSLFNGSALGSETNSNFNPLSGDSRDKWSFRKITLDTSTMQITEPTNFKIYAKINLNDGKKTKSKTVESAFTVYPAGCATTKKAENYSHDEEIMSFQSFVHPW